MCIFGVPEMDEQKLTFPGLMKNLIPLFIASFFLFIDPFHATAYGGHGIGGHAGSRGNIPNGYGGHTGSGYSAYAGTHASGSRTASPYNYVSAWNMPGNQQRVYKGLIRNYPLLPAAKDISTGNAGTSFPPPGNYYHIYYDPYLVYYWMGGNYCPYYYYSNPSNNTSRDEEMIKGLPGFVVYGTDTLHGNITIKHKEVLLKSAGPGKNDNWAFSLKTNVLNFVSVYGKDNSRLALVRLNDDSKNLLRIIHEGKLNIYDARLAFLKRPEDIDIKSLRVVYNGEESYVYYHSMQDAKRRLVKYINKAYGSHLNPDYFNWKGLISYIDKLD
jgi:hypothetical protein